MELRDKIAVITGAGSGIGRATALAFAEEGTKVILVGRTEDALQQTAKAIDKKGRLSFVVITDITRDTDLDYLLQGVINDHGRVDILVNNAGRQSFKLFDDHTEDDIRSQIETNLYAPIRLTQKILPVMRSQKEGIIVNIGSIFGSIGFPLYSVYSATKFGLKGFSEALRRELKDSGIKVIYIAPRATKTGISDRLEEMARETGMKLDTPESVARTIVMAVKKGKKEVYIGGQEFLFVKLNSICSSLLDLSLSKKARAMIRLLNPDNS